jgi:hypothetical protein
MSYFGSFNTLLGRRKGLLGAPSVAAPLPVARLPPYPSVASSSFKGPTFTESQGFFGGMISFFFYLSLMAFFIFLLLVLVHFTITPIFKFDINDKGLVNLTDTGDGQLVWQTEFASADKEASFKKSLNCNYTISMDILVKNQLSMGSTPRVLLYRGEQPVEAPRDKKASDLFELYSDTNLLVYLDADKNDLNVIAITRDGQNTLSPEGIPPIPNIQLETPFRLGIVFQPGYMEVYLNGQLQATRVFIGRPNETTGKFYAPSAFVRETARVGNLQYWPRILGPSELQSAGPVLPGPDFFVIKV